jgi:prophage maintenance system killer protein
MKLLAIFQILELHQRLIQESGGTSGVRDFGAFDEQEKLFLDLASGNVSREGLANWLQNKVVPKSNASRN